VIGDDDGIRKMHKERELSFGNGEHFKEHGTLVINTNIELKQLFFICYITFVILIANLGFFNF
jgi:hypothetical protein